MTLACHSRLEQYIYLEKTSRSYFLIDGRIGGKVMSLTEADLDLYGLSERSAQDRLNGERVMQNGKEYILKLSTLRIGEQSLRSENYHTTIGALPMEDHVDIAYRVCACGYLVGSYECPIVR